MPVWIAIVFFILFPLICAFCFWWGAHFNYKIFMSDEKFENYIKYHISLEKMFNAKNTIAFEKIDPEEEQHTENETDGKEKNGGY